jgi:hypothetical protein
MRRFVTLTFPTPVSIQKRDTTVKEYVQRVQKLHRHTIAFVRGDEDSTGRHSHLILISHSPISLKHASAPWFDQVGHQYRTSVKAEEYVTGTGGLDYVMKGEEGKTRGDWDDSKVRFSDNIGAFMAGASRRSGNARQCRYLRRLGHQPHRQSGPEAR